MTSSSPQPPWGEYWRTRIPLSWYAWGRLREREREILISQLAYGAIFFWNASYCPASTTLGLGYFTYAMAIRLKDPLQLINYRLGSIEDFDQEQKKSVKFSKVPQAGKNREYHFPQTL